MRRQARLMWATTFVLAVGCDKAEEPAADASVAATDQGDSGDSADSADGADATDAGDGADGGVGADGSAGSDETDAVDAVDSADGADGAGGAPTQSGVEARVAGRAGLDLRVEAVVKDSDLDAAGLWLRAKDAAGAPVLAFRAGLSESPDSAETTVPFDAPATTSSFIGTATLRGLAFEQPTIATLEVAVVDAAGHRAVVESVPVLAQTVKAVGDACDPEFVESRCGAGYGCRGEPPACAEGLAPEIDKLAYLNDAAGTRILVAGTDPEDDVESLHIEFLDNAGNAVSVDFDGDETPDGDTFDSSAIGSATDGLFFVRVDPAGEFASNVPQLAVTATDHAGHVGARKTVKIGPPANKTAGSACDPRGFDKCSGGSVCAPGVVGLPNACKAVTGLRATECAAAPEMTLTAGGTDSLSGIAAGASLWDSPTGCASADPVGRPEGIVRLVLAEAVATLTISTAEIGTNFDTVVYLLPGCGAPEAKPLGCSDDTEGESVSAAGTVVLEKVAAGDYLIVIDAWSHTGGLFNVSVLAE